MDDIQGGGDAMGLMALGLLTGLIGKLRSRGVLSDDDLTEIIDVVTHQLEEWGLTDAARTAAHQNLRALLSVLVPPASRRSP